MCVVQVIIQHHDSVVTSSDLGLALHCQYDLGNKTVTNGLDLEVNGEIEAALVENGKVESPTVVMTVTQRGGGRVERAQVGDQLELHFTIADMESPYEVFVRELIAKDGNDQNEIMLLDSNGCPTEGQIMGPLTKQSGGTKTLIANFDAFKFPTSEVVQFRALVTPCMPRCQPVQCVYQDYYGGDNTRIISYGRRRRDTRASRQPRSVAGGSDAEDLLVTHTFQILDNFDKEKSQLENRDEKILSKLPPPAAAARPGTERVEPGARPPSYHAENSASFASEEMFDPSKVEVCLNVTCLVAGVAALLILQLIFIIVWTHFLQRRNKKKMGISAM